MCLIGLVPLTGCASGYIQKTIAEILTYFYQIRKPTILRYISEIQAKTSVKT